MSAIVHPRPPGRIRFFAALQMLDPRAYERVEFAYRVSKNGNAGKFREDGSRAFDHPKAAAWIYTHELGGLDPRMIVALLLHDELEDNFLMSPFRIRLNFGKSSAYDVQAVTKIENETIEEYLDRVIIQGPWAILTKLCDRLHNIRTLHGLSEEKRDRQLTQTSRYHLPILIPSLRAYGKQWAKYADMMEQKILAAMAEYA